MLISEDFPSSPDHAQNSVNSHIYHEIPDDTTKQQQPIYRPIQAQLFHQQGGSNCHSLQQGGSSCNSTSSSGYGTTSTMRYDNVRGEARGPFVSYPILEDRAENRSGNQNLSTSQRPKRPTELALHNSPLI